MSVGLNSEKNAIDSKTMKSEILVKENQKTKIIEETSRKTDSGVELARIPELRVEESRRNAVEEYDEMSYENKNKKFENTVLVQKISPQSLMQIRRQCDKPSRYISASTRRVLFQRSKVKCKLIISCPLV